MQFSTWKGLQIYVTSTWVSTFQKKTGNIKEKGNISLTLRLTVVDSRRHDEKPRENTARTLRNGGPEKHEDLGWNGESTAFQAREICS